MYSYNVESGVETIYGIKFTPIKTVGGSAKGQTHYGYTDPRNGEYKVCECEIASEIAEEIAATQLPTVRPETVDIDVIEAE